MAAHLEHNLSGWRSFSAQCEMRSTVLAETEVMGMMTVKDKALLHHLPSGNLRMQHETVRVER